MPSAVETQSRSPAGSPLPEGRRARRSVPVRWLRALEKALLDLVAFKPIAVFVWWFSTRANTLHFASRRALRRRIDRALVEGRPVLVASNHVSWFDDPVIPIALYRSGERALVELGALAAWLGFWALDPLGMGHPALRAVAALAGVLAVARWGCSKLWWTLGDLANLSDASVLRGKLELTRGRPPGALLSSLLRLADVAIRHFMRSDCVRTLLVDRGAGESARRARAQALERAIEVAARPEAVWIFFEGGRSKRPGEIAPARRGVGALYLGLREQGLRPLLIALSHRGMQRLIPPGGRRFLSGGHRVEVRWAELDPRADDARAIAEEVRAEVVRLQAPQPDCGPGHA